MDSSEELIFGNPGGAVGSNQKVHYIMTLDDSGSMYGKPWDDLIKALKDFMKTLEAQEATSPGYQKITVIEHSHNIRTVIQEQTPAMALV